MTLKEIENLLLIAPIRFFKDWEPRGYFGCELIDDFGVDEEQVEKMLKMRSTFGWKMKVLNGEKKYFFYLR